MRTQKKISSDCSRAGQIGASIRWENHVKVSTSLIRINTHDRDYLSCLAARRGVSVGRVVAIVCDCLRSGKISLPSA